MLTRELRAPRFVPRWGGKERTSDLQRAVRRALSPDPRAGSGRVSWLRSDVVAWRTHVACGAWDYRTAGRAGHNYVGRCYRSETHARVAGIQRCMPGGRGDVASPSSDFSRQGGVWCCVCCGAKQCYLTKPQSSTTNTLITSVCANDGQSGRPNIWGLRGGGAPRERPRVNGKTGTRRSASRDRPAILRTACTDTSHHAMSTRRPAVPPSLQRILFHNSCFSFRSHIL